MSKQKMKRKGIGYYRVSTIAQDITRQKTLVEDYCRKNDIELVRSYEDKVTGTTFEREGFNRLLNCSKRDGDIVIISEFSRFSRDANLLGMMNEFSKLTSKGFDVVFLDDSSKIYKGGTDLPVFDVIMLIFKGFFAQEERKAIVNRLSEKRNQLMEDNHYALMGNIAPFGYEIVDNPQRILKPKDKNEPRKLIRVNERNAEIVRQIFKRYADGETSFSITKWFKSEVRWAKSSFVPRLLNNRLYIGERKWGKRILKVEPIVDMETWNKVQERKRQNRKHYQNTRPDNPINLLKGLVHCGKCGSAMTVFYTCKNGKARNRSLICLRHLPYQERKDKFICDNAFGIQKRVLELIAKKSYLDVVGTDAFKSSINQTVEKLRYEIESNNSLAENIKREIGDKEKERRKIPKLLLTNSLNPNLIETLNEMDLTLQREIRELRAKQDNYIKANVSINSQIAQLTRKGVEVTPAITPTGLAEEFQNTIETITVYSPYKYSHFVQIIYKSGYIADYICWSYGKTARIAELVGGTLNKKKMTYVLNDNDWDWQELFDFLMERELIKDTIFPNEPYNHTE